MSWLLDVNLVLATRWTTHAHHQAAKAWIDSLGEFSTCAISELGFVQISLSVAYRASWEELIAEPWATGIAENPLVPPAQSSSRTPNS